MFKLELRQDARIIMMASCHTTLLLACSYICGGTNTLEVSKCKHSSHTQLMIRSLDDIYIFITFALLAGRFPSSPNKNCGILPSQHTTILPWQILQTNYNIFMNVEILKRNGLFQGFFFLVKENIELSGTIFWTINFKV